MINSQQWKMCHPVRWHCRWPRRRCSSRLQPCAKNGLDRVLWMGSVPIVQLVPALKFLASSLGHATGRPGLLACACVKLGSVPKRSRRDCVSYQTPRMMLLVLASTPPKHAHTLHLKRTNRSGVAGLHDHDSSLRSTRGSTKHRFDGVWTAYDCIHPHSPHSESCLRGHHCTRSDKLQGTSSCRFLLQPPSTRQLTKKLQRFSLSS